MMREIKFRAWHDEHKTMVNFDNKKASNDIYIASNILKLMADNSPFLMQYTGLKDKNGVEIYEGDIIKDSSGRLMIVEWDSRVCTSMFIFKVINTIGHIKAGRIVNTHVWITSDDNDIEVIGNIYENKELLNTDG